MVRSNYEDVAEPAGAAVHGADGPSRSEDGFAVPYLRPGQFISLVRWSRSRDGWLYNTVLVQYVSRDDSRWNVLLRGEAATFPRAEWALFC